jgi:uncharacterized protein (TIGR02145 family)
MRSVMIWTFLVSFIALISCNSASQKIEQVSIGGQTWMAENLDVGTFRNGDPIPEVQSADEWLKAAENRQPAWCYYNNEVPAGVMKGRLYNWFAVSDPRGLAPEGWHIPSDEEWDILAENATGGAGAAVRLKSAQGWAGGANGTDDLGFNAMPYGGRGELSGFTGRGRVAVFWSSTPEGNSFARYRVLHASKLNLFSENDFKSSGFSVRCLKDQ